MLSCTPKVFSAHGCMHVLCILTTAWGIFFLWVFNCFFPRDTCEVCLGPSWLGSNLHSYNLIVLPTRLLLNAIAERQSVQVVIPHFSHFHLISPLTFPCCLLALSPCCLCLTFPYFRSASLPRVISPFVGAAGFLCPKVFTFQVTSLFRYWICHILLTFNV